MPRPDVTLLQCERTELAEETESRVRTKRAANLDAVDTTVCDCVVIEPHENWEETVRSLRSRAPRLPILVTGSADPRVGALASRLGVEYAPAEAFEGSDETLDARVLAVVERSEEAATDAVDTATADTDPLAAVDGEPWFEAVFDHPTAFVALLDTEGCLLRTNQRGRKVATESADERIGRPFWELSWGNGDESFSREMQTHVERAVDGETVSFRTDYHALGERRTADGVARPVTDGDDVVGAVVAGHDVTEMQRTETALRELHDASTEAGDTFDEQVERLLAIGCEYLGLEIGFLAYVDEEDDRFEVAYARGDHPLIQADTVAPLSTTYCRKVLGSDDILMVTDAPADGWRDDPAYELYNLGCYVGGQLTIDGESAGSLCFADDSTRDREFSSVEESFVELLVERATYELERERREAELQTARDQLETVIERIDDGFVAIDTDWQFTYLNETGYQTVHEASPSDLSKSAVRGQHIWDVLPDGEGTVFDEQYQRAMETQEPVSFEAFYEPLDAWLGVNVYPSSEGLSVFFQDVTQRRSREEALNGLLSATKELMAANGREEVAAVVCETAEEILGLEYSLVRLYDPDRGVLAAVDQSPAVTDEMTERPLYEPGEGLPGRAFERGEMLAYDSDDPRLPGDPGQLSAAYCFPLGTHGTLTVGTRNRGSLGDDQRALASLLVANAQAALDRAGREERLQQYRAVHENVKEMVFVIDSDGEIQLVTHPLARVLGVDEDTLVGTHASALLTTNAFETGERLLNELAEDTQRASRTFETTLETASVDLPVEIELSLLPSDRLGGAVGVVRDRSELETERARFTSLFERSPDAIIDTVLTDDGPIVRDVNPAFEETFGIDRETAVGRSTNDLIVPDDEQAGAERLDELDPDELTLPTEIVREAADGRRTFLFRGVYYGETADGTRAFGIYTDISEQKLVERRIGMLHRVLRHNLRNSGTVAEGYLEMLAATVDEANAEYATRALEAVSRIMDLSEKVHDIERAFDQAELGSSPAELSAVVDDAIATTRAENPDATFQVSVDDATVRGGELVSKAVTELVENAATHAGEAPCVRVTANVEGAVVRLSVLDDGPGIPERERAVITGDTDITQLNHSRGLGLWLAWYVTLAVDGSLAFDESHDGGAVVLELPRYQE